MHHAAEIGFTHRAQQYQQGRPEYPSAIASYLQQTLKLGAGQTVLDLGAGTGKFTKLLVQTAASVVAVEPIAAMREQITTQAVTVLAGHAEAIPLPDSSVDVICCAQAFHWFANGEALAEMHRVLRANGKLCLIWNTRDESFDWVAAITQLMHPHEGDAPRYYTGQWKAPFYEQNWFGPASYHALPHAHIGAIEQVIIDRFMSVSFIAALDEAAQQQFKQQLLTLRTQFPALQHEAIAFPYRTELWLYSKLD
ncbi:class I SAM-dependent methyltransferase [Chitinibacter fontanus]|uniref:Class I SAM-dependent methyltransferase n=1 Tax=Chitinibacter fontanus TaxID=1737446 RepID=A0A7D5ZIL6_9NEIS|nr:class I SAM-dependent methyltransferase [Chitinibacter fontanus]QLI81130.1 class I SAM-dependent methyltransferase [Chitinibacter fontanus]